MPTFSAVSAVIGHELAIPRIPSVPKYLRVIDFYRFSHAAFQASGRA
jgi:hypothetical protein